MCNNNITGNKKLNTAVRMIIACLLLYMGIMGMSIHVSAADESQTEYAGSTKVVAYVSEEAADAPDAENDKNVKTGDESNISFFLILFMSSLIVMVYGVKKLYFEIHK